MSEYQMTDNKIYLKRTHLCNQLEQAMQKPLTTVVSGAGYGKTLTVYEFLQEYEAVTIWLQLSQFDNLSVRFWENLIYAISLLDKESALVFKKFGFPETTQEYSRFSVILANTIKPGKKYVLVCDDFHLIYKEHVLDFFNRLLDAHIPNLSIVIISRKDPEINLMRLYSKDMVSVINEDSLRFSKEEVADYFKMQDIHLSTKTNLNIYHYTEGWIFAIRLVELSLRKLASHEDYAILVAEQNIFKLIDSELFSEISKELQVFLIKLSLVDNLPLELLTELSSGNTRLISEMDKTKSFIRYDAFLKTYRIHHLFLKFLIDKQFTLDNEDKIEIYHKAADWYARNGHNIDALTYYEKAGMYDKMFEIICIFYPTCPMETGKFVYDMLNRIPEKIYALKPFAQMLRARFLLNFFNFEESYKETLKIVEKFESMPQNEETRRILGESYITLGLISLFRCTFTGDYIFQKYFKLADEYLPNGSTLLNKHNFPFNSGNYSCTVGSPIAGEFNRFIDAMFYTMPYASKVTNGSGAGTEYLCLAEKLFFQMNLLDAEKYASIAINESRKQEQYAVECLAIFYLVRINMSFGKYSKIMSLLEQLRCLCEKCNTSESYKLLDMTESWFYSQIKQPSKVTDWIRGDIGNSEKSTTPINFVFGHLVQARFYLAEQKYHELLSFLDKEEEIFGPNLFLLGAIEQKIYKATALYHIKETKEAITTLQEAYSLAAPDSLFMPFVESGNKMRTLTKAAMKDESCTIPTQWLEMVATKSSSFAKRVSKIISDYRISHQSENDIRSDFTIRELELLNALSHGLSREEIAIDLNLSINTVKHMLQIVFGKLGAENTIDAVRIAISKKLVK